MLFQVTWRKVDRIEYRRMVGFDSSVRFLEEEWSQYLSRNAVLVQYTVRRYTSVLLVHVWCTLSFTFSDTFKGPIVDPCEILGVLLVVQVLNT